MAHYGPEQYWLPSGAILASRPVRVFPRFSNTLAALFADPGLTIPMGNPVSTDVAGMLEFYAAPGDYWIFVNNMSFPETLVDSDEDFWPATSAHEFLVPADPWIIAHGMSCRPVVFILDAAGLDELFAEIIYIDDDNLQIDFGVPTAGTAYLRR